MPAAYRIVGLVAAVVIFGSAVVQAAQVAPGEDPMIKGLRDRGLKTLLEAYLKQQGTRPSTAGQTPVGIVGGKAELARLKADQADGARNIGQRETLFQEARKLYEEAAEEGAKAIAALAPEKQDDRNRLRMQLLKMRLELVNLIFLKWLRTELDILEVTDRRGADRDHATGLLKVCADQTKAIAAESSQWLSELDRLSIPERSKFVNTGTDRDLRRVQREAKLDEAWVTYYYAWLLPTDYKPPAKQPTRKNLLDDAITMFQTYTPMSDRVSAKWYAHMVIGMAYREMGKYGEAMQAFALADNSIAPEGVRIRLVFERALTLLRKGDLAAAHKAIDDGRAQWKEKLDGDLYGLALPLVEAEIYIAEAKASGNNSLKEKGVAILQQVHTERKNPWPQVVQWLTEAILGATTVKVEDLDPFQLWIMANDTLRKAQESKDPKEMEQAADLYGRYAEKAGTQDKNYATALYSQAACYLQLQRKAEAADLFCKVADEWPKYQYASQAAKYNVSIRGEVYESAQTEENRQAYEDALRWFTAKWGDADPGQQYYLGVILYRGKKYVDAIDAFSRVREGAEHYPDSKYWVPLCHLDQFREKILESKDAALIVGRARDVARMLLGFGDYAAQVKGVSEEKKKQLTDWAEAASSTVVDIYLYPEVNLPADVLPILDAMDQKYPADDDAQGRRLKQRIDALQKLNRLDEAQKALEDFLKVAKREDVGPVLRGLLKALTDDVKELIKRGQKELAAAKVKQAMTLGERLRKWLDDNNVADKALQIENNRYDLAELFLAVGDYLGALQIYQEIGGSKPWVINKNTPVKEDCVHGMARAYEGLGETAPDAAQAKPNFETALDIWMVLLRVAEAGGKDRDINAVWDRKYHMYYCRFRLGQAKEVYDNLKAEIIISGNLGGKDPVLQQKFRELVSKVAAAGGGG
jgi:tetratricopeptide (TPR) repeat protein